MTKDYGKFREPFYSAGVTFNWDLKRYGYLGLTINLDDYENETITDFTFQLDGTEYVVARKDIVRFLKTCNTKRTGTKFGGRSSVTFPLKLCIEK